MIGKIVIDIKLPEGFPQQYKEAIVKAVESCTVKKHIQNPPEFEVRTL
jgi:ribosomal protein S12 methylthiotransferase accessory factor